MLNTKSPIPLYHQLAEILMKKIRSGEYQPGQAIPSETGMAKAYRIGRPTVRQAVDILVRKGVVERKRGSGTYVREAVPKVDLFSLAGTSQAFQTKGIKIRTLIIEGIVEKKVKNDKANPFNNHTAYFLSRITKDEIGPILLEEICLHAQLFPGLDQFDMKDKSLSAIVLDHYYLEPVTGRQSFKITYLDSLKSLHLEVEKNTPVLEVTRSLDFPDAADAVFSRLYCLTDRFSFSQSIRQH